MWFRFKALIFFYQNNSKAMKVIEITNSSTGTILKPFLVSNFALNLSLHVYNISFI